MVCHLEIFSFWHGSHLSAHYNCLFTNGNCILLTCVNDILLISWSEAVHDVMEYTTSLITVHV
jgi:hypothetical protein